MKITCIQMDMAFGDPDANFTRAARLIADAMQETPDVILLPETWNTGFYPREDLAVLSDRDCRRVKAEIGALAERFHVNIIAGSAASLRGGQIYNTACIFDRSGACIGEYDKTHLFSPMGEDRSFAKGSRLTGFLLDGVRCGILICYDLRFPEAARSLALEGMDILFIVCQWPAVRIPQMLALARARAIENQVFTACCNSCGRAGDAQFGGCSVIFDPLGNALAQAGPHEQLLTADCGPGILPGIRSAIPVFADRRSSLYRL